MDYPNDKIPKNADRETLYTVTVSAIIKLINTELLKYGIENPTVIVLKK